LSNKENVLGKMIFGGYDLSNYAKKDSKVSDIKWLN
jgi:hypothetical protein